VTNIPCMKRNIHPLPEKISWFDGSLILQGEVILRVGKGLEDDAVAAMFETLFGSFTSETVTLKIRRDPVLPLFCAAIGEIVPCIPGEEWCYGIRVDEQGAALEARDMVGLRYAWYTFLQLLQRTGEEKTEGFALPHCDIRDRPAMKFRGIHLCLFPETPPDMIEKALTIAAFAKYNYVVFESFGGLEMETIRSWKDVYCSKVVISPILEKARVMGMEIIPMINSLGHATFSCDVIGKNMTLECNPHLLPYLEPYEYDWCISNPATVKLLKAARAEMYEICGSGEYFHMGGDESYFLATCDRCAAQPFLPLVTNYLNNMCEEICSEGRRPIMWSDMLLNREEWECEPDEAVYANSAQERPTHLMLPELDRRFVIADWQYDLVHGKEETGAYFKSQGFDTILCPWKRPGNVETLAKAAKKDKLEGVMLTTWSRLRDMFHTIVPTASLMWNSNQPSFIQPTIITTHLCRKLCPSGGEFLKSGWANERALLD